MGHIVSQFAFGFKPWICSLVIVCGCMVGCGQGTSATSPAVHLEAGPDGSVTIARSAFLDDLTPVVKTLAQEKKVTELHLYDCNFKNGSLAQLDQIGWMEYLEIRRGTNLGGNSVSSGFHRSLKRVRVERLECSAETLRFLTKAPVLTQLQLSYSQLDRSTFELASQLPSLVELNLHHATCKAEDWQGMAGLPWTSLNLDGVSSEPILLQVLTTLPQLKKLSLAYCDIPSGWEQLKDLRACEWLDVTGCAIDDAAARQLESLPTLKVLQLNKTKVTEAVRQSLQQALPACQVLNDESTQIDYRRKTLGNQESM